MTCKETVTVNADAVDWLKKNYPELCIKAGLCERVGGTLYTRTFLRTTPPVPTSLKIKAPNESGETMCVVKWMAETPLGWVGSFRREALEQFYAPAQTPVPPRLTDEQIKEKVGASDDYWVTSKLFILSISRAIETEVRKQFWGLK